MRKLLHLLAAFLFISAPLHAAIKGHAHLGPDGKIPAIELPLGGSVTNVSFPVSYTAFAVADTTSTLTLVTPSNYKVLSSHFEATTPFTGGSVASVTASLGYDILPETLETLIPAFDVFTEPARRDQNVFTVFLGDAIGVGLTLTSTGANLNELTAGAGTVRITYVTYP